MWSGKHAQDYSSIHVFGCLVYYHAKNDIPNTFNEARYSSESGELKLAIEQEIKPLYQNRT